MKKDNNTLKLQKGGKDEKNNNTLNLQKGGKDEKK